MARTRTTLMDRLMNEHVRMPGVPGLIVTRAYVYFWAVNHGYDRHAHGFGSAEYLAFGIGTRDEVDEPLATICVRDRIMAEIDALENGREVVKVSA